MAKRLVLLALLLSVALPGAVTAQTVQVGQLTGEVTDPTGGRLSGATVTLTSVERGFTRTATTEADGRFRFRLVSLGSYDVNVSLPGFQAKKITNNLVEADKTTTVNVILPVGGVTESTTVVGEVPIVDPMSQTVTTRLRADEFARLPMGRSYQALIGQTPGVVGTGNVNAHGALTASNQFMADGITTTDTVTGTFGNNMNYEAIAEVVVRTAAISAEFGRSTGAYVDVITKSGSNQLNASFKALLTNDQWDEQNSTKSEVAAADGSFGSLARSKFDKVNKTYSFTVGGPVVRNRAWFFVAHEDARSTTPQVQLNARPGVPAEDFQQVRKILYPNVRGTVQVTPAHNFWVKYASDPFTGIVRNDYWTAPYSAAEREALTAQKQGGYGVSGQYTAVFGDRWTAEVVLGYAANTITVEPFERTQIDNGAPYVDLNDNRVYNGATFDGYVKRPRSQASVAANYFATVGGRSHNLKFGLDTQQLKSENAFRYPNNQIFYGFGFEPVARAFAENDSREDYDDAPSASEGSLVALYMRDRFQVGPRATLDVGLRVEHQSGKSDVGAQTVKTTDVAPRLSMSYALTADSKTLVNASYGRFYDGVLQSFSDTFANIPQQENYNTYIWNGSSYQFSSQSEAGANNFKPDTSVRPRHMDEVTIGGERQIGRSIGASVRYVQRAWADFIDDTRSFNADGGLNRVVRNLEAGERTYKGVEIQVDKRIGNRWAASGSYTYAATRGNHVDTGDNFTALGDHTDNLCRQTVDPGLFGGAAFPCSALQANLNGRPTFDRPHNLKFNGSYLAQFGPVNLVAGLVGHATSKTTYQKSRTISVLSPITGAQFTTMTYWYEPRGSQRVPGLLQVFDLNVEAGWRGPRSSYVSARMETFNLFNNEEKISVSNTAWCESTATSACATTVANFGKATARGAFATPRTVRAQLIVRY